MTYNDLDTFTLPYFPPAPANAAASSSSATSIEVTWDSLSGAEKYRVEYRPEGDAQWTTDDDTLTGTSHAVDGLSCATSYQFRVSAYGNGTDYGAHWGRHSSLASATTNDCPAVGAPSLQGSIQPTSMGLSWEGVAGATKYQVRHRESGTEAWTEEARPRTPPRQSRT